MPRAAWIPWISSLVLIGCLEPNPNVDAGTDTGTSTTVTSSASASSSAGTETGMPPEPVDFAYEQLVFDAGPNGFEGSLPKPAQEHVTALAIIDDYSPRNADALGYAVAFTDNGNSYTVTVTLDGADNNSRVRGRAIALGFATAPHVQSLQVDTVTACASVEVSGSASVDAVQLYAPMGGAELSYTRTATPTAGGLTVEYCIGASSSPDANLGVALLGFTPPAGVESFVTDDVVIDSQVPASATFPQIDAAANVLHLLSARGFDEAAASNLGYTITCATTAPFSCSFDIAGFNAGARVVAGGLTIAVP